MRDNSSHWVKQNVSNLFRLQWPSLESPAPLTVSVPTARTAPALASPASSVRLEVTVDGSEERMVSVVGASPVVEAVSIFVTSVVLGWLMTLIWVNKMSVFYMFYLCWFCRLAWTPECVIHKNNVNVQSASLIILWETLDTPTCIMIKNLH